MGEHEENDISLTTDPRPYEMDRRANDQMHDAATMLFDTSHVMQPFTFKRDEMNGLDQSFLLGRYRIREGP
jgi:hypothetical protein